MKRSYKSMLKTAVLTGCLAFVSAPMTSLIAQSNQVIKLAGNKTSYVALPYFITPEKLTIDCWIKTTQTGVGTIVSWKKTSSGDGDASIFRVDGGKLLYGEYFGGSWKAVKSTGSVNTGAWTHVAVVRNGNTCLFYINGTASGSGTLNASPQKATTNLNIGCIKFSGAEDIRETYNGGIDNLRIWSTARTADDIKNELGEVSSSEGGLEAYYKFEDNANDTSTKGRNGTSASGITYELSKVMDETPATIESLTFSESSNGTIFWGIRKAGEAAPTAQDLASITSAFAMSGSEANSTATQSASVDITPSLDKGSEYKLYGTIRNVVGIYSPVFDHSFT